MCHVRLTANLLVCASSVRCVNLRCSRNELAGTENSMASKTKNSVSADRAFSIAFMIASYRNIGAIHIEKRAASGTANQRHKKQLATLKNVFGVLCKEAARFNRHCNRNNIQPFIRIIKPCIPNPERTLRC